MNVRQEWAWKLPGVAEYLGGVGTKTAKRIADQCKVYRLGGATGWYKTADLDAAIEALGEGQPDHPAADHEETVTIWVHPLTGEEVPAGTPNAVACTVPSRELVEVGGQVDE